MKGNFKKGMVLIILAALTLAAFSMLVAPSVKAQITGESSEANIVSYSWYVSPSDTLIAEYEGDLVAVGEVQNVGSNVIGTCVVAGEVFLSNGTVVASSETNAYIDANYGLLPGQKAPFYIDFPPEDSVTQDQSWVPLVNNVTLQVSYVSDLNNTQFSALTTDLVTSGVTASDSSGTYTVTGNVQNNGNAEVGTVWIDATFYNASGAVVGLNFTDYLNPSGTLAPGDSVPFTATPTDDSPQLESEIANYSVLIQAEAPTASSTGTPVTSTMPSSAPTSSSPTASPIISAKPSSSTDLIYGVVAAVVIIAVVVTSLALFRKRRSTTPSALPPPPPPPPPPPV